MQGCFNQEESLEGSLVDFLLAGDSDFLGVTVGSGPDLGSSVIFPEEEYADASVTEVGSNLVGGEVWT